jgi:hypothetical protein
MSDFFRIMRPVPSPKMTNSAGMALHDPGDELPRRENAKMLSLAQYFLVTFGWTWTVWWTAVFAGRTSLEVPLSLLFMLGGLGPAVGSVFRDPQCRSCVSA